MSIPRHAPARHARARPLPRLTLGLALLAMPLASCGAKSPLYVDRFDASPAVDAGTDAPADTGPPDAGLDAMVCVPGNVPLDASRVEVVFVIDRSGSMLANFEGLPPAGTELSRWETLQASMVTALSVFDDRVGVGAKFFPSRSARPTEDSCAVFPGLDVGIGPGHSPGVIAQFDRWRPAGGTPLGPATREALDALLARADDNTAQFIVVATDGQPTCTDDAVRQAFEVVRQAHEDHGIDSYVVGIASTDPEVAILDSLAVQGGRARPATEERRFYDARDPALLEGLLSEITRDLTRCVFNVPFPPGPEDSIDVLVSGVSIPRDEARTDGWDWTSDRRAQLSLFGDACAAAIDAGGAVRAIITCR